MRRLVSCVVVGILFAGGAAACSSDSEDSASTDTTAASTETTAASTDTTVASTDTAGAVPAGAEEFCGLNDELNTALNTTTAEEFPAAAADVVDSGLLDEAVAAAPVEIADQVALAADAVYAVADGSLDPSEISAEASAAGDAIDEFCGVTTP